MGEPPSQMVEAAETADSIAAGLDTAIAQNRAIAAGEANPNPDLEDTSLAVALEASATVAIVPTDCS